MLENDRLDLIEFAKDHIRHFNAVPCEFETGSGELIPYKTIWEACKSAGLLSMLNSGVK